jgi:hypothetical protein
VNADGRDGAWACEITKKGADVDTILARAADEDAVTGAARARPQGVVRASSVSAPW